MRQHHRKLLTKLCDEAGLMSSVFYLPAEDFITRMRVHDTDEYAGDDYQEDLLQGDERTESYAQQRGSSEEDGSSSAEPYGRQGASSNTVDLLDL
ncbi:hypothetical protein FOL47_000678 [Perkinsus chesapeaki]|uniref:Uncharacterized protein n=1 Tax=Perkinsus chesapeaki TaxID=330153 RepID=A0A7J6KW18_PERCH|nr:hypothetical protein FOL47_000678 [Perkinsus chesapeaki]